MARFSAFGATGLQGQACPVPAGTTVLGITVHSAEEHDSWCNCMFSSDAAINARCKQKVSLLDPSTYKYGALPWTTAGKDARALPGSIGFTKLVEQGVAAGAAAVGLTKPAPAMTPATMTGGTIGTPYIQLRKEGAVPFMPGLAPRGAGGAALTAAYTPVSSGGSKLPLFIGLGLAGVAALFLFKPKRGGALSGYSPRRRRSRR